MGARPWEDIDDTRAMLWLQDHGILVGSTVVHEIVNAIAKAHAYHSVIDYFRDLGWTSTSPTTSIWDGTSRVGGANDVSWLTRYLGVPDSPYVRAVDACWAISGVDRIFNPGCKAPVLVLGDKTGIDKSAVFKILGGPFYSNNIAADACLALTTAAPISNWVGCDDGAWISLSPGVPLTSGNCIADPARTALSAVLPTDGMYEPTATTAGIGALDEFALSHDHKARLQTPTVANTLTATAALRNLIVRLCEICPTRRDLDVTEPALIT